jgi:hypothetical protein
VTIEVLPAPISASAIRSPPDRIEFAAVGVDLVESCGDGEGFVLVVECHEADAKRGIGDAATGIGARTAKKASIAGSSAPTTL